MPIDLTPKMPSRESVIVTVVQWARARHTLDGTGNTTCCGVRPPYSAACVPLELGQVTCKRCLESEYVTLHSSLHRPCLSDDILGAVIHAFTRVDKELTPIDFHCDVMATDEAGILYNYSAGTCGHDEAHMTTHNGELIHIDHEPQEKGSHEH